MNENLGKLKKIISRSAFSRSPNYSVNVDFKNLFKRVGGLISYNESVEAILDQKDLTPAEIIAHMTPEFQRENTKWTQDMQIGFVENLLCGCDTKIQLYDIRGKGSDLGESLILDGLQRLTAIASYHTGEFPVFNEFYWNDVNHGGIFPRLNLIVSIFQFDTNVEACSFYLQMNKGTTHSEGDLETAYAFLKQNT